MPRQAIKKHLQLAIRALEAAGKALLDLRGGRDSFKTEKRKHGQLKSEVDEKCENLVISLIKKHFPDELILAEEKYTREKKFTFADSYWLLDALDGTRSFHEGYDGFCVQLAFIENGEPKVAVVSAPVFDAIYWAVSGEGAYLKSNGKTQRLSTEPAGDSVITYTDNHLAEGKVAEILRSLGADRFLESGSIGLKICRVAEGKADIFLKAVEFKIWDTAPGELILKEAGGEISLWSGKDIDYSGKQIYFKGFIAASTAALHKKALEQTKKYARN